MTQELNPMEALAQAEAALEELAAIAAKTKSAEELMAMLPKLTAAQKTVDAAKRNAADALYELKAAERNAMVKRIEEGELTQHFGDLAALGITGIRFTNEGISVQVGARKSGSTGGGNGGPKPRKQIISDGTHIPAGDDYGSRTFFNAVIESPDTTDEWKEEARVALDRAKNWANPPYNLKAAPGFDASVKKLVAAIPGVAFV